jgi:hypothetical protein
MLPHHNSVIQPIKSSNMFNDVILLKIFCLIHITMTWVMTWIRKTPFMDFFLITNQKNEQLCNFHNLLNVKKCEKKSRVWICSLHILHSTKEVM